MKRNAMKKIPIFIIVGLIFSSCEFGCNNSDSTKKEETPEHKVVQQDIYNYFNRTDEKTVPERTKLRVATETQGCAGSTRSQWPTKLCHPQAIAGIVR